MYFNISDIKTYNIDESYKQCFSNIKNSVEYSLAIDYMLERFDKNIVKEICLFLYKFKFATKKQIINVISKKYNISIDFNFQELVDFDFFKDFILVKGFVDEEYERNEENTIYAIGPNGINLLIEYFNIEVPRWEFRNISRSADKVIKSLQGVNIYKIMMESFKDFNIIKESAEHNKKRALKDKFDKFIDYFTEDGDEVASDVVAARSERPLASVPPKRELLQQASVAQESSPVEAKEKNITKLHARQQQLAIESHRSTEKVTIDVRYPRRYEDATDIVDLLAGNESILIDFQYMTEVQARRCLDYLDGARHVLAGELRKVAHTMYLLTPVGVVVNIEDIRLPEETQSEEYDFDMKRNRVR